MNIHYPIAIVVVDVEVEPNKPVARMLKGEDWVTVNDAEEKCLATPEKSVIKEHLRLKPGVVECITDKSTMRKPLSVLYGKKCRLQLIARPINVRNYVDSNNQAIHELEWEVDRVFML